MPEIISFKEDDVYIGYGKVEISLEQITQALSAKDYGVIDLKNHLVIDSQPKLPEKIDKYVAINTSSGKIVMTGWVIDAINQLIDCVDDLRRRLK